MVALVLEPAKTPSGSPRDKLDRATPKRPPAPKRVRGDGPLRLVTWTQAQAGRGPGNRYLRAARKRQRLARTAARS